MAIVKITILNIDPNVNARNVKYASTKNNSFAPFWFVSAIIDAISSKMATKYVAHDDAINVGIIDIFNNLKKDILCRCVMVALTVKVGTTIT